MVAKKRERKPAIRLVRDSSSDEGGARSVVTFLFWNGAQWRRRWFISWVSASISEQSALSFPNQRKASKLKRNLKFSSFFVSLHPLRVQVMDISSRHCVHCADRSTMPRNISSSFSLLRFPPQFAPSFVISLLFPLFLFFFFFRFAIESFLRSFLIFFPIRSSLPLSFTRKKKKHDGTWFYSPIFEEGNFSVDAGKPAMNSNQGPRLGPHSTSRRSLNSSPPRSTPMRPSLH